VAVVETIAAEVERVKAEQEAAAVAAASAQVVTKAAQFSFHPVLVAVRFHRKLAHEIP
jgi:hypothetical protein